ncbi:hypothetical protein CP960_04670 [Malaciobacter halophilus]|uniref:HTH tetR-type domain-containing protein n=1 Tax=Malaciobacter halophilus TaxID=197482 RepID=A0A2N1J495_9BACT|nr:TetR/AcrR family transcriptional regulator [Malaciobacter halophilus]AXH08945.1 transcriptional regulator, TetR/AcrR family [Malaciobacter halophilus]PKI81379.1 hypothetical protein CP960_04670 [Malaciobacter halophilus]
MAIKKTSKEEILNKAIMLFKTQGFSNTSMANIADECGLIKGSIYHHFKNKYEIGLEALKYISEYFDKNIFSIKDETLLTKEKLEKIVKKTDEYFLNSTGGCLLANLATEVSNQNEEYKAVIVKYFKTWEECLTKILQEKYTKKEAQNLAYEYICTLQGSIIMFNLTNDKAKLLIVGKNLLSKV